MAWAQPADDNPFADPSVSAARTAPAANTGGAPSWLTAGANPGAPKPPPPPPTVPRAQPAAASPVPGGPTWAGAPGAQPPQPTQAQVQRQAKVPQLILYMRMTNMCLCILLCATGVIELLSTPDISGGVLACYLFAFAVILCCFETHLKVVAKTIAANFGFLYNAKGRAVFLVFVGVLCFSFGSYILGIISGILMLLNACFNFYVIFRYPEIEREQQRKDLESEGRDFLRANRGQMANAAATYARNNPEQAAQAARAAGTYV